MPGGVPPSSPFGAVAPRTGSPAPGPTGSSTLSFAAYSQPFGYPHVASCYSRGTNVDDEPIEQPQPFGASGNTTVDTGDELRLANLVCDNTAAAVNELKKGFLAGGTAADSAATGMLQAYVSCGEDAFSTTLSAIRGGLNGPDRTPMVQLLTAMAAAFDRIGWPICFTVATEDLSTGNLSNEQFFHTNNRSDLSTDLSKPAVWTWYTLGRPFGGGTTCVGFGQEDVTLEKVEDPTVHFATGSVAADTSKIQPLVNDICNNTARAVSNIAPMLMNGGSDADVAAAALAQANSRCRATIYSTLNGARANANPPPFNDVVRAQRWAANTAKAFDDAGFPICLTVATADRSTNKLLDQSFFYTGGP